MAESGSLVASGGYKGRTLIFNWVIDSQSATDNTTTISWNLKGYGTAPSGYYKAGPISLSIDGVPVYEGTSRIQLYNGTTVASGTKTLSHDTYGDKNFSVSISAAIYSFDVNTNGSDNWWLKSIPRKAIINSAQDFTDEGNPTITFSNPGGFDLAPYINIYNDSETTILCSINRAKGSYTSPYTFNLTSAERELIRENTTSQSSYIVWMGANTYNGSTVLGWHSLKQTLTIVNADPSFTYTLTDSNNTTNALTGDASNKFIKGYSEPRITMNATAYKEASISSCKVICGSQIEETTTSSLDKTLTNIGSASFILRTTDSRKLVSETTLNKTLIEYFKPSCNISVTNPTAQGACSITISGSFFNDNFGVTQNTANIQYRYKSDGEYCDWVNVSYTAGATDDYTVTVNITGLDYREAYTFQARFTDQLETINSIEPTVRTIPVYDWGKEDFNFNVPLYYQGNPMDFVIEEDDATSTNGTWYYRKWYSGKLEQWGKLSSTIGSWISWGSVYESSNDIYEPYPITFLSGTTPYVSVGLRCDGFGGWLETLGAPSNQHTAKYYVCRPNTSPDTTASWGVDVYALGRWK